MYISQTPQDSTKGKLPRGKEPEPFKDEAADKTQKVNREKRKIPDSDDLDAYVEMALRYWEPPFPFDRIREPMYIKLDERVNEKNKAQVARTFAKYKREKQLQLCKEEADNTQKVDSTKGKLPRGKELELFKEEADKTQKVDSTKGKLPCGKEPEPFKEEVDKTQNVDNAKGKLPSGKEPGPFKDEDDKTQKVMNRKKRKLIRHNSPADVDIALEQPFLHDYIHEPINIKLDEETIAEHKTQVAKALARLRENKLKHKKTQKVDSTKGKLDREKELEPFMNLPFYDGEDYFLYDDEIHGPIESSSDERILAKDNPEVARWLVRFGEN